MYIYIYIYIYAQLEVHAGLVPPLLPRQAHGLKPSRTRLYIYIYIYIYIDIDRSLPIPLAPLGRFEARRLRLPRSHGGARRTARVVRAHTCAYIYIYIYKCVYIYIYIYIYVYVYIYIYIYICVSACVRALVRAYTDVKALAPSWQICRIPSLYACKYECMTGNRKHITNIDIEHRGVLGGFATTSFASLMQ